MIQQGEWIKEGAIVIDCGINVIKGLKIFGIPLLFTIIASIKYLVLFRYYIMYL